MPAPCKIISIGSHNEWGFEEAIVARTNCTVDTFDCTGKGKGWAVPSAIAHRVVLHEKCIGGAEGVKAGSQDFITWQTLLQLAGMTDAAPTYLKMDIEGCVGNDQPASQASQRCIRQTELARSDLRPRLLDRREPS